LLIVKVIFVITVFFLFLLCVSTILVNKDDQGDQKRGKLHFRQFAYKHHQADAHHVDFYD